MTSFFNILIAYHTSDEQEAKSLKETLSKNNFESVYLANENEPSCIEIRVEYLKKSSIFIILSSRNYQNEEFCMELANYARDLKKEIFALNTRLSFRPFGALGAIIASANQKLIELDNESKEENLRNLISCLNEIRTKEGIQGEKIIPKTILPVVNLSFTDKIFDVIVSYHPSQRQNVDLIEEGFRNNSLTYELEDSTKSITNVKTCRTLIIVMSDDYEQNYICKSVVNLARSLRKHIIPVAVNRGWKSKTWLGLVTSGKLYFRFLDKEQVYKKVYDTTPINDFLFEVSKSLNPRPIQTEREKLYINSLQQRIDDCKKKLKNWPPPHRKREKKELKPVKIEFKPPKGDIEFSNIHYTVNRMGFTVPKSLYDNFGVPIREKFDAMISYQWANQKLVRNIFEDLHMKNLLIWFDIWGYMEGCTYDAMATAIESSKVILVFLSNKYQESANCQLEFKYAVARGKPFIFILVEDNLNIEPWIKEHYEESLKFEIKNLEDENILDNGVARLHVIAQAIRDVGSAQIVNDHDQYELSDETIILKEMLEDALDEIDRQSNTSRFRQCTRCKQQFDDNNLIGCRKHSAYYLDGTIMAGRWVCCGQLEKDSVGCVNTDHIYLNREWFLNQDYGTYTWEPA